MSSPDDGHFPPAPDEDADTGPIDLPARRRPADPFDLPGPGRFDAPLTVIPRQAPPSQRPILLLAAAALIVVLVIGGLVYWLIRRPPAPAAAPAAAPATASSSTTAVTTPSRTDAARVQLRGLLPRGYPPGACRDVPAGPGARARVQCGPNTDPGGPLSASYTLLTDRAALDVAFADVVGAAKQVNCPGNIQSPGPWRRNATPDRTAGMLFCGLTGGRPTVAWTTEAALLLSSVQSEPQGPTFEQLYGWWSSHS